MSETRRDERVEQLEELLTSVANRLRGMSLVARPDHRETMREWADEIDQVVDEGAESIS